MASLWKVYYMFVG